MTAAILDGMSRSPFLHPFARPAAAAKEFITIVRGEGAVVWDDQGNDYIDGLASLWYCNVGHGRWEIVDFVASQMAVLENYNTFDIYTNDTVERLAAFIAAAAPMNDSRIFFTSSGTEAVETALKLARLTTTLREPDHGEETKRVAFAGRVNSYHGVAYGGLSVQGLPLNKQYFGPLLPVSYQIDAHDFSALETLFAEHGHELSAFITEPVQGAGGVFPSVDGYLQRVRQLCDEHDVLLIFDEVITGFGRLGSWFGAAYYDVVPDMITFAKACTSGYLPLGGVVVGEKVLDVIEADPNFLLRHGYTYSGHPTACAAALANCAILAEENLFARTKIIAERLGQPLHALAKSGAVAEARGIEGIWAVGLHPHQSAVEVRNKMLKQGVIARPIGTAAIAFCPPLVISEEQLDRCAEAVTNAVADLA